jgi:hypothetical protein
MVGGSHRALPTYLNRQHAARGGAGGDSVPGSLRSAQSHPHVSARALYYRVKRHSACDGASNAAGAVADAVPDAVPVVDRVPADDKTCIREPASKQESVGRIGEACLAAARLKTALLKEEVFIDGLGGCWVDDMSGAARRLGSWHPRLLVFLRQVL